MYSNDSSTEEALFRKKVASVMEMAPDVDQSQKSARAIIHHIGSHGLISERWQRSDDLFAVVLIDELASADQFGLSVAVSLHVEAVLAILGRFASTQLRSIVDLSVAGDMVGCIGASEPGAGSDLSGVKTTARMSGGYWYVTGEKKFVTLSTQADFVIALARMENGDDPRFCAVLIPREGYEIVKTHSMEGAEDLDTSWIVINAKVPAYHMLGRPGLGIAVLTAGLVKERLSISAQLISACRLAISLSVTRAHERRQFGSRLWDHQILRLRLAALHSEWMALLSQLRAIASRPSASGREIAGLKVTASRFAERCLSECMHIFGGDGYVTEASPLGGLWRAVRMGRIGGGTDEMMWEIIAKGLKPDYKLYNSLVHEVSWRGEQG